jgi:hypothetical protein
MADVVAPRDVDQCLAGLAPGNGFLALVVRQLGLAAHENPLGLGALTALAGAGADELALKSKAEAEGDKVGAVSISLSFCSSCPTSS